MYVALLDTCALWPSRQRDFLLSLAVENVYRPMWSDVTLEELEYHEAEKLRDRGTSAEEAEQRAAALLKRMCDAFSGATIDTWATIRPVGLPDPDDEHVVAAAIIGGADVIVTDNVRDFPPAKLPGGLKVIRPAPFLDEMVQAQPVESAAALRAMAARLSSPRLEPGDLIDLLEMRYGISTAADVLRDWV
ncbi:PIN domain-containing protein [Agrococcus sp. TSP3-2-1]|uniref:PIN domain-containing protein n=1 Tax=Agrococcus sp. TSP3-2-1 TaxID=2804583 RepID=UPI003CF003AB